MQNIVFREHAAYLSSETEDTKTPMRHNDRQACSASAGSPVTTLDIDMAKVGDTVRYLNAVGGGKIVRIDGRMAYVDEDGFETPVLLSELVVVLPEGHESKGKAAKLMFDQSAADAVKARELKERKEAELTKEIKPAAPKPMPVEETKHGEKLNLVLAFEPADIKRLSETQFAAVLVNDSNYFLAFAFLTCEGREWRVCYEGTVEPNMVVDLATFGHTDLGRFERVALQAVAFKRDKGFGMKPAISCEKRLDLKKFYKLHCFRPGIYFDTPVLEVPLVRDDMPVQTPAPDAALLKEAMGGAPDSRRRELAEKYAKDSGRPSRKRREDADNPHKLLPLIEVDLHIDELVDTTAGMDNAAMLGMQLDTVRRTMKSHARRVGQKIVFIHGKGDGVLREGVRSLLRREYGDCDIQDASFREYGFGATLVTIKQSMK